MKQKVYVAFGEALCNHIGNEDWELAKEYKDDVRFREFETDSEAMAYKQGLEDAFGWQDVLVLLEEEVERLELTEEDRL